MALYEYTFLARPDLAGAQIESLVENFGAVIANGGGSLVSSEYWGVRPLPYRIKKNRKAHFAMLKLDAPPAAVDELRRQNSINEDVLRFFSIKVEAHEVNPSPVMQEKTERGTRRGRGD